jgi:hypothetical protein
MKAKLLFLLLNLFIASSLFTQTFTNVANQVGVQAAYYVHNYVPGGGVATGDLNNDGLPDVIVATADQTLGSGKIKVYRNDNGTFTDVTASSGINFSSTSGLKAIIIGDYNNDGWRDVYITNWYTGSRLYKNNGNGIFTDVTSISGITEPADYQPTASSWIDYNKDGFLDLYICNYGNIESHGEEPNFLFKNNGNGTFTDVTLSAGVGDSLTRKPLAIVCFDYNNDGWQDILISNDKLQRPTLYKNNGDGTFTDVTMSCGIMCFADGMGLSVADIDHSGNMSVSLSNGVHGNFLFKNNGNGTFTDISASAGIQMNKNCWGSSFFDYDNDGWADLYVTASLGVDLCDGFFKNNRNYTFTNLISSTGLRDSAQSHCTSVSDFNNDGYPDLIVTEVDSNTHVYRNSGFTNNWIKLKCTGTISNRDAIGSSITIYYGANHEKKVITGGNSYLSCEDVTLIFGIGTANNADSLTIKWTNGMVETAYNIAPNNTYHAVEGSGLFGIENISSQIPNSISLYQNYPNPFNPSTKIKFDILKEEFVKLIIYDIMGREIETLVKQKLKPGIYSVDFNANKLSTGVYFYQLHSGSFTETKKMILTK